MNWSNLSLAPHRSSISSSLHFCVFPFLPFRCWSQGHSPIYTMHAKLRLRVCFPEKGPNLHNAAQIIYNVLSVDTVVTLLWNCSLTSALILAMLYCLYWAIKFFCVWFCWHYSIVSKNLLALFSKYIWRNPCFITSQTFPWAVEAASPRSSVPK